MKQTEFGDSKEEILYMLQKRRKEQACMYRISNLNEDQYSIGDLLQEASGILTEGWQYKEVTAAAFEFDGKLYKTPNYKETNWIMSAESNIRDDKSLVAKVVYLEERPTHDDGPFLKEERKLLESIINNLSAKINHILFQQELKKKQQLLDKAYNLAHIGTWEFDMKTHELSWSPVTKEVHGFGQDYKPDVESTINLFKEGEHRETFRQAAMDAIEKEKPFDVELKIISGQGDERWIRATGHPEYKDGICTRFYGISQNVTARRRAEEKLHLSEQRFKSLVQGGSDLIAILDGDLNYTYVSPTAESILGMSADDYIGTNALDYIHENDIERLIETLSGLKPNQRVNIQPFRFKDAENNWHWIETTFVDMMDDPAVEGLVANSRDVTEHIVQQRKNLDSLREKEILLAEIHHRVKNNLAVVSGLMQLQAAEEVSKEIRDRLYDGISRIQTMANIHEQLYKSKSFSKLEFADNIQTLVMSIFKTFQSNTKINIDFDCEPVQININQAIPCSQIVNEVVTNIFKHAFPERDNGYVKVCLYKKENNQVFLSISDDGIGLPDNFDVYGNSSLGINLIDVLSKQLNADYEYKNATHGTYFVLRFEKDEIKGIGNGLLG